MKKRISFYLDLLKKLQILPSWVILFIDILIISSVSIGSYLVFKGLGVSFTSGISLPIRFFIMIFVFICYFLVFKTYQGIVRYSTHKDVIKVFKAVFFSSITLFLLNIGYQIVYQKSIFVYYTILNGSFFAFFSLIGFRILVKYVFQILHKEEHKIHEKESIAIIGVNSTNITLVEPLSSSIGLYRLICFFDTNTSLNGKKVAGVPVVADSKSIIVHLRAKKIRNIILPKNYLNEIDEKKLFDDCIENGIKVFKPELLQKANANSSNTTFKEYQLEELLFRKTIDIDNPNILKQFTNKVILVTGGAGSIGSELAKQITEFNPKQLIVLDQGETALHDIQLFFNKNFPNCNCVFELVDVTNRKELAPIFDFYKPEIIFHAAAYKHVPVLEKNYKQAIKVNVFGTQNCLELAVQHHAKKFIFVSTDKAVNPTNIMGASKRIAEMIAQNIYHSQNDINKLEIMTTRFGNVLGSNGSVVHLFKEQIAQGGPVTVTHPEVNRFFMTIPEACKLVIEAAAMGNGGHIYVFDMGKSIKIVDLADKMIRLAGKIPGKDIVIEFSGLRPGEKLYEEVLTECSETLPTYHPKIVIAKEKSPCRFSLDEINKNLQDFHSLSRKETVFTIKKLVPEYQPENMEN
ncbi:MAG: nucleoside-diphosphate sugar epimerase/dehydratase [Flavobacterium sp.]|jgi:FlaA1/EpsC-like NDP-sugar epimerase|uniref:polysaccharide biosynthesis protein n=1 Tax=Flavobacterium sp. TaxID=239 RepID=UPI0029769964|nr:nucleoside-diphosphate sugar epimerase/dehydratase [Flavobacterium sp.]TAF09703.1 MAG: polysaccharide biosynthesis protein [Flavobacteriia bacterium]WRH72863.1 MAG: nucleoside-diphosphate sugar epimerase/dehydratase [Flavobacterium sp.]